jgi:hypothetical protein
VNLDELVRPKLVRYTARWPATQRMAVVVETVEFARPVVLSFHGGPEGEELPGFRSDYQALLMQGIAVLARAQRPRIVGFGWEGSFYARGRRPADYLAFYAQHSDTVDQLTAAVEQESQEKGPKYWNW